MRSRLAAILPLVVLLGCEIVGDYRYPPGPGVPGAPAAPLGYENPMLLRIANHEVLWDGIVDVVSQYFRIERESRSSS